MDLPRPLEFSMRCHHLTNLLSRSRHRTFRFRPLLTVSPLTSVFFSVLLASCDEAPGGSSATGWQAAVDTMGDTIRIRTLAGSVWRDTARLIAEVTIGAMDGPDEYVIGYPEVLEVTADGTILLLDTQVPVLRAYDPDGTHLRDIGKQGSGPGEYESPDGVGVLRDGRILVRDPPNSRISLFSQGGEPLGQWFMAGGFNSGERQWVDREGNSYLTTLLERGKVPWEWEFGVIRYSTEGEIVDTIPAPTWDYEAPRLTASNQHQSSVRRIPFSPSTHWAFSPLGYMVGGLSTDYRIELFPPSDPVLHIEREWMPIPVHPDEAAEQRRRITEGLQRQYGSWRWNGPDIPDIKIPFKDILVSEEGNLWVVLSTPGVAMMTEAEAREERARTGRTPIRFSEPVAFDVFSPDGRYLGPVAVPVSFRTEPEPVIRGDHVWAITRDELDVPRVVRFRLELG